MKNVKLLITLFALIIFAGSFKVNAMPRKIAISDDQRFVISLNDDQETCIIRGFAKLKEIIAVPPTITMDGEKYKVINMINYDLDGEICGFEKLINADHIVGLDISHADYLQSIGDNAFMDCKQLKGDIMIPKSVKKIGSKAFFGCNKLNRVYFENESKCNKIGEDAFTGCMSYLGLKKSYKDIESSGEKQWTSSSKISEDSSIGKKNSDIVTPNSKKLIFKKNSINNVIEQRYTDSPIESTPYDIIRYYDANRCIYDKDIPLEIIVKFMQKKSDEGLKDEFDASTCSVSDHYEEDLLDL